jgi:hypothetical protein
MPTLYTLSLSYPARGFVSGPVRAIPATYAGNWREEEKDIMQPDPAAVRECLPHYYRAAFDRSGGFWFPDNGVPYLDLVGCRGTRINTLYACPYSFKPRP